MPVEFDYNALRGFIRANFKTNKRFAKFLGIGETALYDRLSNRVPFTQTEMDRVADRYGLDACKTTQLFFTKKNTENRI